MPVCLAVFGVLYFFWPHVVDWLHITPSLRGDAREVVFTRGPAFSLARSISLSAFHMRWSGCSAPRSSKSCGSSAIWWNSVLIFVLVGMGRGVRGLARNFFVRTALDIVMSLTLRSAR